MTSCVTVTQYYLEIRNNRRLSSMQVACENSRPSSRLHQAGHPIRLLYRSNPPPGGCFRGTCLTNIWFHLTILPSLLSRRVMRIQSIGGHICILIYCGTQCSTLSRNSKAVSTLLVICNIKSLVWCPRWPKRPNRTCFRSAANVRLFSFLQGYCGSTVSR